MNHTPDWTTFEKRIFIQKPIRIVYESWATKEKIENWFLEKADYFHLQNPRKHGEYIEAEDHFIWKWHNWEFEEEGKIIEANGNDRISFTFGDGGIVHVVLKEKNQMTEVVLRQENIPTDEKSKQDIFVGCATGWTFWLTNLKCYLEYGITLHATGLRQEETKDLVNS